LGLKEVRMFAKLSDTTLFYDICGPDGESDSPDTSGKPIIIAINGGYGFDHTYLRLGLSDLEADYQIVYVDMRGHGRSPDVKLSTITFDKMAHDINELMTVLGIDSAFIFGHEQGGFIAQNLAIKYPARVNGLILVSSSMGPSNLPGDDESAYPQTFLKDRDVSPELMHLGHLFFYGAFDLKLSEFEDYNTRVGPYYMAPENMDMFKAVSDTFNYKINLVNQYRKITPFFSSKGKINNVKVPTLLIAGAYDWAVGAVYSSMLSKQITNSEFVSFANSGHFPFIEEPDLFKRLFNSYMEKNASL